MRVGHPRAHRAHGAPGGAGTPAGGAGSAISSPPRRYGHEEAAGCHRAIGGNSGRRAVGAAGTGRYASEGSQARLDIALLALPISWRGSVQQYVGRSIGSPSGQARVSIYDHVDAGSRCSRGCRQTAYRLPGAGLRDPAADDLRGQPGIHAEHIGRDAPARNVGLF